MIVLALGLFTGLFALLPNASDYPFPQEEFNLGMQTLVTWLSAVNGFMPLDTLYQVLLWGITAKFAIQFVYPIALWLFGKAWHLVSGN